MEPIEIRPPDLILGDLGRPYQCHLGVSPEEMLAHIAKMNEKFEKQLADLLASTTPDLCRDVCRLGRQLQDVTPLITQKAYKAEEVVKAQRKSFRANAFKLAFTTFEARSMLINKDM